MKNNPNVNYTLNLCKNLWNAELFPEPVYTGLLQLNISDFVGIKFYSVVSNALLLMLASFGGIKIPESNDDIAKLVILV